MSAVISKPNLSRILAAAAPRNATVIPLQPVTAEEWKALQGGLGAYELGLAKTQDFNGKPGEILIVPDTTSGAPVRVYAGISSPDNLWAFSTAATALPAGLYKIDDSAAPLDEEQAYKAALGWALARYRFKIADGAVESAPSAGARLLVPPQIKTLHDELVAEITATWSVRDLINAPANVLNTQQLKKAVLDLAAEFNAAAGVVEGAALEKEFPLVHAVGKASANPPALVHFSWSGTPLADSQNHRLLLVGKGITFDTGGIQIKPGDSMKTMKKDMGGAATAMGLARMIMAVNLPVDLTVVVPIAENAVAGNAFHPEDVITARDGTTVEIGHTDAEGRLILADALSFGVEKSNPQIIIDFATLTGAQRVADGTEVGGVFSNDKEAGRTMEDVGDHWNDELQFHRLHDKYRGLLKSGNGAQLNSAPRSGPGAAIAAMFLQHFLRAADKNAVWFHFDINGGNDSSRPGRPAGGEAMGMRAAYRLLRMGLEP